MSGQDEDFKDVYRKVSAKVWTDAKFRALSAMAPSAQGLWFWMLTAGRERCLIPGLIFAGIGTISDALGWGSRATRKALQEIVEAGMALIDDAGRMIFLPNAIKYNFPDNPNIILGWRKSWAEIPEGEFRNSIHYKMLPWIKAKGPAFLDAFLSACPPGNSSSNGFGNLSPDRSGNPSTNHPGNLAKNGLGNRSGNQITDISDQVTASKAVVIVGAAPEGTGDTQEEARLQSESSSPSIKDSATTSSTASPVTSPPIALAPPPAPGVHLREPRAEVGQPECQPDEHYRPDDGAEPADFEEVANDVCYEIQVAAHEVLHAYNQKVTAQVPKLFRSWNEKHPGEPQLSVDEFCPVDPENQTQGAKDFRRLSELLTSRPEAADYLRTIFNAFANNTFAWGVNEKGTAFSLGFLLSNAQKLEKYAVISNSASKRSPRSARPSRGRKGGSEHDRSAADEEYRQAMASSATPPQAPGRTSLDVLSSK